MRFIVALVALSACVPDEETPSPEPAPSWSTVGCEEPVGGEDEVVGVEGEPGYDELLQGLDLTAAPVELDTTTLDDEARRVLGYALELGADLPATLSRDELLQSEMGRAMIAAFVVGETPEAFESMLRRGLHRYYLCSRQMPASLDDFMQRFGDYRDFERVDLDNSVPKERPRTLFEDHENGVYVGETYFDDGSPRETEVVLRGLRDDGALDFLVFDAQGVLNDRGAFATITGTETISASPRACLTCHVDFDRDTFDVVFPEFAD